MNELTEALVELAEKEVRDLVETHLSEGRDPLKILANLKEGMDIVGQRFSEGEYFLVELVMSAEVFNRAMDILEPKLLETQKTEGMGTIVIGTVKGDIHYIGKNLVVAFLKSNGFDVHDLGEDVAPETFIEKLKESGAPILALSGLITTTHDVMRETVDALETAGLRNSVMVMIGGCDVNQEVVEYTGADAFGVDAVGAVEVAGRFLVELGRKS
ncbi:MAG: cobalamin B12-binding domain-containing protein [Candidatus Thorarchaeota archaeon]|jgi:5-methyltetrahydrofolate--homocysteine methyltransferase